jgi:phage shock protein A
MTNDELVQFLANKFATLEKKIDSNHAEVKVDVTRLEANQRRLETKLDGAIADIKELKFDVAEIKQDVHLLNKLDEIDSLSINAACNDIKEIKEKVNNLDKQSNIVRVLDKSVPSLQVRLSDLEDEVAQIKKHLDKAS